MAHLYALPAELAQPVARGQLPLAHAYAAMLADTVRAERLGEMDPYKAPDVFRLQKHLLGQHLARAETKRALAEGRIVRVIKPMIAVRRPSNAVLAEAHGVNGAAGFPLAEDEVTDIVRTEMYWSLPIGGRRHVG